MQEIDISFKNNEGLNLSGRLWLPPGGKPEAFAIFAHCFTCNKNFHAVRNISQALVLSRIAVLSFDFTGLGRSQGDFADTNFSTNVADLVSAAAYLEKTYDAPQILVGHSLGGAAVLHAARDIPSVKAIAVVGAPYNVAHVSKHLGKDIEKVRKEGEAEINIGGRSFHIKQQFLDDINSVSLEEGLGKLRKALLILHSPLDNIVGIDNASKIFQAAKHPKSFISLDDADHLLTRAEDGEYAAQILSAWVRRFIEPAKVEHNHQVFSETSARTFTTHLSAGGHLLVADEPESFGGKNLGPSPYDLLLASLGACTSMTIQLYANRKKWPLERVRVYLDHAKIHAKDCADCETEEGKIDSIERKLELEGDLSEEQLNRLLEIADKCPVHRTLHSEIRIVTGLK